jgi:methionyl-tRNA formyltransferase
MKIGIVSNHFSFPAINYLLKNNLAAGFAIPEILKLGRQNFELISEAFKVPLTILHKETLTKDITSWISTTKFDAVFIFSFPYKIPEAVLYLPKYGFINFHPGILPEYRGPDPMFWQIKNGVNETGITAYKIDKDLDTGPILHIEKEKINSEDTYGLLGQKLAHTLVNCVEKVVGKIKENNPSAINYIKQDEKQASYFGKPKEKDLVIDWEKQNAEAITNLVKASNPRYHGATTYYKNLPLKLLQISVQTEIKVSENPGTVINSGEGIKVACINNKIIRTEIIYVLEGYYSGETFKKLFNVKAGDIFSNS